MSVNENSITEDAEMADSEGDKVVTMMDVLQEQQDFEDDANAVLGASDDKECTYSKGYIKRQAVYACLTCCSDAGEDPNKRAGVCLACSLNCHENHELIELYTKRNFNCDCGNPKFNSHPCQYTPNKTELNNENIYNQNFSGLYCICHRPYPDPEAEFEDEMIQCIICEDWLHAQHLDAIVPSMEDYAEMVCKGCMDKNEFLHDYSEYAVNVQENGHVDVVNSTIDESHLNVTTEKSINGTNGNITEDVDEITEGSGGIIDVKTLSSSNDEQCDEGVAEPVINSSVPLEGKEESLKESETENESDSVNLEPSKKEASNDIQNKVEEQSVTTSIVTPDTSTANEKNEELKADCNQPEANPDTNETDGTVTAVETSTENNSEATNEFLDATGTVPETSSNMAVTDTEITKVESTQHLAETMSEISNEEITSNMTETMSEIAQDESTLIMAETNSEIGKLESTTNIATTTSEISNEELKSNLAETISEISKDETTSNMAETISEVTNDESKQETDEITETTKLTDEVNEQPAQSSDDKIEINDIESTVDTTSDADVVMKEIEAVQGDTEPIENGKNLEAEYTEQIVGSGDIEEDIEKIHNDTCEEVITNTSKETEEAQKKLMDNEALDNATLNVNNSINGSDNKRKLSTESVEEDLSTKKPRFNCTRPKKAKKIYKGATFWPSTFRQHLCRCNECITMYKDLSVLFLIDIEDTVSFYEALGKEKSNGTPTQYEQGLEALSSLDRIQQINALTEYNKMRDKLLDFLKSFKDRKEVVKEEDIKAFFAGMKPKREPDGVYFCR